MLAPFIVAAVLCVAGLLWLRWITHNRPILVRTPAPEEDDQDRLPFDELKSQDELRDALRRELAHEPEPHR